MELLPSYLESCTVSCWREYFISLIRYVFLVIHGCLRELQTSDPSPAAPQRSFIAYCAVRMNRFDGRVLPCNNS